MKLYSIIALVLLAISATGSFADKATTASVTPPDKPIDAYTATDDLWEVKKDKPSAESSKSAIVAE